MELGRPILDFKNLNKPVFDPLMISGADKVYTGKDKYPTGEHWQYNAA
jgi:hypothetical protein